MKTVTTSAGEAFVVSLTSKTDDSERLLGREPIHVADLTWARDETWLYGMSAGALGTDLSALSMSMLPGENRGADRLAGYFLELRDGDRSFRRQFSITSLVEVSRRAAMRLVEQGQLGMSEIYKYHLTTVRLDPVADQTGFNGPNGAAKPEGQFTHRFAQPVFEPAPLATFLNNSRLAPGAAGAPSEPEEEDDDAPVFISREVWQQGLELARRGGESESAAVWVGRLMRDTQSPAIFLMIDACLEAEHAAEEKYAVSFTGDTWARLRDVLEARRRRLQRPHERILGSVHGHNFMPEADELGRRTCAKCATAKVCTRTTAVASEADLRWHRSVFAGQPWALLLVWGFNAREQDDHCLYGLQDASLAARSIRLLDS